MDTNKVWKVALAVAFVGAQLAYAVPQKTVQYTFDGTATNSGVGAGLDLTLVLVSGSPVYSTGVNGIGQALNFSALNGAHSAAGITSGNAAALDGASALTITGWLKADSADTYNGLERLVATADGFSSGGVVLGFNGPAAGANASKLQFAVGSPGTGFYSSPSYTNYNSWVFFALTWINQVAQPSGNVNFYVGTESASVSLVNTTTCPDALSVLPTQGKLAVGNRPGLARGFDGALDDVRIYTSTSGEVLTLAQLELIRAVP
ncbi:MAG: hypothetical protein NTV22_01045, partial [bacterium]|nr:hypothetical protein [bacterium]